MPRIERLSSLSDQTVKERLAHLVENGTLINATSNGGVGWTIQFRASGRICECQLTSKGEAEAFLMGLDAGSALGLAGISPW
tara:strand:- start:380 stop:625 length:246 start_codon:yes stop_codon:yes gene_type:complete